MWCAVTEREEDIGFHTGHCVSRALDWTNIGTAESERDIVDCGSSGQANSVAIFPFNIW